MWYGTGWTSISKVCLENTLEHPNQWQGLAFEECVLMKDFLIVLDILDGDPERGENGSDFEAVKAFYQSCTNFTSPLEYGMGMFQRSLFQI
jgi:hypothetical protein